MNPLRYRGYVYDTETRFYYLQSRYYDPELGRFINSDALVSTGQGVLGNNMFTYCGNNPIRRLDFTGTAFADIYAVCFGGSASSAIDIETDGITESEALAEFVLDYYVPVGSHSVSIDVRKQDNPYYHTNLTTKINNCVTVLGGVMWGASKAAIKLSVEIPALAPMLTNIIPYTTMVGEIATVVGVGLYIAGKFSQLPDGKYSQYFVTVSWSTFTRPTGFPDTKIYTSYSAEMIFIWNDGCEGYPGYWYLLDRTYNITSRTYH